MMNKNLLMFVCAGAFAVTSFAADALRPNILIIFTDDQGYADLAC